MKKYEIEFLQKMANEMNDKILRAEELGRQDLVNKFENIRIECLEDIKKLKAEMEME